MSKKEDYTQQQLERAKAKDSTDEGRKGAFMMKDAWNQDGNPAAAADDFGPVMKPGAPPTMNGKPL
ncbi:hypothetical protein [Paenibacillus barengoltzii]|uniref:hypothetical protein n=1 Tax=Paenibacillus barengoltzii TaxID=343517 RepID=UPI000FDA344D|nr:hypothetical protein [Paenibacillus barengoltzii]